MREEEGEEDLSAFIKYNKIESTDAPSARHNCNAAMYPTKDLFMATFGIQLLQVLIFEI